MTPIAGYVLARSSCEAARDATTFLPHDLNPDDVKQRLEASVEASEALVIEFSNYYARSGFSEIAPKRAVRSRASAEAAAALSRTGSSNRGRPGSTVRKARHPVGMPMVVNTDRNIGYVGPGREETTPPDQSDVFEAARKRFT